VQEDHQVGGIEDVAAGAVGRAIRRSGAPPLLASSLAKRWRLVLDSAEDETAEMQQEGMTSEVVEQGDAGDRSIGEDVEETKAAQDGPPLVLQLPPCSGRRCACPTQRGSEWWRRRKGKGLLDPLWAPCGEVKKKNRERESDKREKWNKTHIFGP